MWAVWGNGWAAAISYSVKDAEKNVLAQRLATTGRPFQEKLSV
jgi:hypothetical protein